MILQTRNSKMKEITLLCKISAPLISNEIQNKSFNSKKIKVVVVVYQMLLLWKFHQSYFVMVLKLYFCNSINCNFGQRTYIQFKHQYCTVFAK